MKNLYVIVNLVGLLLVGCDQKPIENTEIDIEWYEAAHSIDDYKRMQPGRPILAIFISDWDLVGAVQRKILEDDVSKGIMKGSDFLCLWYKSTDKDDLGIKEMHRLKRSHFPFAVLVDGSGGDDIFYTTPVDKGDIYDFLREARKVAEQVEASDR